MRAMISSSCPACPGRVEVERPGEGGLHAQSPPRPRVPHGGRPRTHLGHDRQEDELVVARLGGRGRRGKRQLAPAPRVARAARMCRRFRSVDVMSLLLLVGDVRSARASGQHVDRHRNDQDEAGHDHLPVIETASMVMAFEISATKTTPRNAPSTVPSPPRSWPPPMTAAASACSSSAFPRWASRSSAARRAGSRQRPQAGPTA